MMDFVELYEHETTGRGLMLMMDAAIGPNTHVQKHVAVCIALFVEAIARVAEDKPEWFPHGKWATIQGIQGRIYAEINKIEWSY